uniref:Reverse transcriptase/retrotransposon-derived protein RNase H-like domain-containing protein n=1 Tax=Electrophorus electricus TaxID=8005 RepID=A0AAY5E8R2_ELEEL
MTLLPRLASCKPLLDKLQYCQTNQTEVTSELMSAFSALKSPFCSAPALGLPNYSLPVHVYACGHDRAVVAVLAEEQGGGYRPVALLSKTLDNAAQGLPVCLYAATDAAVLVQNTEKTVLLHHFTRHTSH